MTCRPPPILSIFFFGQLLLEVDLLPLLLRVIAVIYCISILFWLVENRYDLYLKVRRAFARLDDYLEFPQPLDNNDKHDDEDKSVNTEENNDNDDKPTDGNKKIAARDLEQYFPTASQTSINTSSLSFIPCSSCHKRMKAMSPSDPNHTIEILILDPNIPTNTVESTVPESKPDSYAEAALASLANDLEFDVVHLTSAEAEKTLVELESLRCTIGSRVCLFTKQSEAFDPDAWYGEACLIDALKWLLRKRLPVQSGTTLEFSGFELERQTQPSEGRKGKENKTHDHEYEEPERHGDTEMQDQNGIEIRRGLAVFDIYGSPDAASMPFAEDDASQASSDTRFQALPTARELIGWVEERLYEKLNGFSSDQIDTVLGRLKARRARIIAEGTSIIPFRTASNDASIPEMREVAKQRAAAVKAQIDAHVALVDGIMLVIRQMCESSQPALSEISRSTCSVYSNDRREEPRDPSIALW